MSTTNRRRGAGIQVTAPSGVTWTRRPDGTSSGQQLLEALDGFRTVHSDVSLWTWWEEGRRDREHDRHWRILREWDNGAPKSTPEEAEDFAQAQLDDLDLELEQDRARRADLVANSYDEDRETGRLRLLRARSDAAFFGHVLAAPAGAAQRDDAERRLSEASDGPRRHVRRGYTLGPGLTTQPHPTAVTGPRGDNRTEPAGTAPNRIQRAQKSGASPDHISRRRTPCSRFAPDSAHRAKLGDHYKIDRGAPKPVMSCKNSERLAGSARVELRGFEPLTL